MRFRDIKTFPHCGYRVDVPWSHLERHIARQEEQGLDLNPDFQREHVWTPPQQTAYVEYILCGGTSGKELYFNHPGWMRGFEGEYVIVDGKQRIEAVRSFMRGEIPAFGHLRTDYTDDPDIFTGRFSWNIASVATRKEVLEWYLNFNAGGTPHTANELNRVRMLLEQESL